MQRLLISGGTILCTLIFIFMLVSNTARAEETTIYLPAVTAGPTTVEAAAQPDGGRNHPWRDHAAPWVFEFGNRMDQHQQSKKNGTKNLNGFLYIDFTGEMTKKGVPIAVHTNCNDSQECTVGWIMHGILTEAELVAAGQGRPQWCIPAGEWPTDNPDYTHFHWIREGKGLGEATPGDRFTGYLIKLTAVERFAFGHSGNHGDSGGPPDGTGSGGSGGGCDDDSHDDDGCSGGGGDMGGPPAGTGSDGTGSGCEDGSHDDGGCSDGSHDDGGCSGGGGGHDGQPMHIPVEPGVDLVTHANVTVCE